MLVNCSQLLRRCHRGDLPHQLAGLSLQAVGGCFLDSNTSSSEDGTLERIAEGAAASTSSSAMSQLSDSITATSPWHLPFTARYASTASASMMARRREVLREAAQKVPADSTWLPAYSNTIKPRQITFRLGKRSSLRELAEGWQLYQQRFDTIAMAAFLRRIRAAQFRDPDFDLATAQCMINDLEARVRTVSLRFGRLRDVTAYLHALAKLRSPLPRNFTGPAGAASDSDDDSDSSSSESDSEQPSGAILSQPTDLVLDLAALATRNRTEMLHASPQRLATLLWSLTRLLPAEEYGSEKLQVVLDRVALCSIQRLQNFAPLDMRMFTLAYATFGPKPAPGGKQSTAAAAAAAAGNSSSAEAWPELSKKGGKQPAAEGGEEAQERRQKRNARVLKALADELASRSGNLALAQPEPRDLALSAGALALQAGLQPPPLPLLAKASTVAAAAPGRLAPQELVGLVEALAVYGVRQPALLEAVKAHAEKGRWWGGSGAEVEDEGLRVRLAAAFERLGAQL